VLGMHFFSPAHIMKLLEIVRGAKTDGQVLATALNLAKRIGKIGVVSGVCHGFIGNRLLQGYIREAGLLMLEGASPQQIDKALYDFGMAMGVLAVMDLAGLDIGYANRKATAPGELDPHAFVVFDKLVELGRKGQKTNAGVYRYQAGSRQPLPDSVVDQLIEATSTELGIDRREISDDEIVERCVFAIVNEGAKVVEDGIAYRASDIDVVYVNGYGFPRYRGGPMFYADQIGLARVRDAVRALGETHGPRWWTPAPLLESLAESGGAFNA
jgi:3-hydroxyacyl-CoA dehydrogenase